MDQYIYLSARICLIIWYYRGLNQRSLNASAVIYQTQSNRFFVPHTFSLFQRWKFDTSEQAQLDASGGPRFSRPDGVG